MKELVEAPPPAYQNGVRDIPMKVCMRSIVGSLCDILVKFSSASARGNSGELRRLAAFRVELNIDLPASGRHCLFEA
jgi:hypothetical protein